MPKIDQRPFNSCLVAPTTFGALLRFTLSRSTVPHGKVGEVYLMESRKSAIHAKPKRHQAEKSLSFEAPNSFLLVW